MRGTIFGVLLLGGLGTSAQATVYTIGPDGAFPTVNAAIADANANPDNHEFRLQTGTHVGGVVFPINGEKVWQISGGWNASFTQNPIAPSQTIWQASALGGTVLTFNLTSMAQLQVRNLTILGGLGVGAPGGIYGGLANASQFSLEDCRVTGHQSNFGAAGLRLDATQTSQIAIARCEFTNNTAFGTGQKDGIGAFLRASNSARISVSESYFGFNQDSVQSSGSFGAGLSVEGFGDAQLTLSDNVIADNVVLATSSSGAGLAIGVFDNSTLDINALEVARNSAPNQVSGNRTQAYVLATLTADFGIGNCLVTNSALGGIYVTHTGTGTSTMSNCTVVNNQGTGLVYEASAGSHSLTNTIVHGNEGSTFGLILGTPVLRSNNLGDDVGANNVNPQFVNGSNDFHLAAGSPAIDTGSNSFNTATSDLDFNPRVVNGVIDIGAYEFQTPPTDALFASGFEDMP
ncbi:hypothetical protein C7S18_04625 [Ahniella affigens]|uniref:Right handed beta helix domain-containing protein n=1 Tax=Ahniella affigens TaxID=2021234 RepID=A0A2P1PNX4_9GAMM|nr:right-handed parallel beta-helix repeat-containing protein [Ahniella affigens]AVP96526.1 hypothetical protein C7S18_04625 [Ahniella affigens]